MRSELSDTSEKTLSAPALGRAILFANLVLVPLVFSRRTVESFQFNQTALLQLLTLLLLVGGVVYWVRQPRRFPALSYLKDPLCLGFVLLWFSALVSTVFSVNPLLSLRGAPSSQLGLLTITAYVVLFFATRALIQNLDDMRRLLGGCAVPVAVTATYALVQRTGADCLSWCNVSQIGGYSRPFATLGHANLLSAYLAMLFPVIVWWGWQARERLQRSLAAILGLLALAVILLCLSRAAWLALGAAGFVLLLGWQRRTSVRLAAVSVGVLALAGLGAWVLFAPGSETAVPLCERLAQMKEIGPRRHLWDVACSLALDRPFIGWGLDTFALVFPRERTADYWRAEWNTLPDRAHNIGLHLFATQGLFGIAAGLVLLVGLIATARRAWRRSDERTRPFLLVCSAGLTAFLVQALFGFTTPALGVVAVTFAAMLSRLSRRGVVSDRPRCCPRPVILMVGAAILVVLGDAMGMSLIDSDHLSPWLGALALLVVPALVIHTLFRADAGAIVCAVEPEREPTGWRAIVPLGLWAGVLLIIAGWFVPEYRASWACADGLRRFDTEPIPALVAMEEATQLDPTNEMYWSQLGQASHRVAQGAVVPAHRERLLLQALAAYEHAADLVPDRPETEAAIARVLIGLNRRTEAAAHLERALSLDSSNPYLYLEAARLAVEQGNRDLAHRRIEEGIALHPKFEPLVLQKRELIAR